MKKEKSKKQRILPGVICVAFLAAIGTFFLLLHMEKSVLSAYEKAYVWCAKEELKEGVQVSKQNLTRCFEQIEMDKSKFPEGMVVELDTLIGRQAAITISKGSILTEEMFQGEDEYVSMLEKPVIAGCKGDDLFQLVSGVLRKGDLVHIYTVNQEVETTYLLWENVMIYEVFDTAGNVIAAEDTTTPAARVNLLLEEGYAEQLYHEMDKGSLRLVKVWE